MRWQQALVSGKFVRRLNRFLALVRIGDNECPAHLPNSGRLNELLRYNQRVMLMKHISPVRKTNYDITLVCLAHCYVCVDARLPPALLKEAINNGRIPALRNYRIAGTEVSVGDSRIDLLLQCKGQRCWVEAKSVTLVKNGIALFPDAPTERGRRHIEQLLEMKTANDEAIMAFVVQRPDAHAFAPNWERDEKFARALIEAKAAGLRIIALRCKVDTRRIEIADPISVVV